MRAVPLKSTMMKMTESAAQDAFQHPPPMTMTAAMLRLPKSCDSALTISSIALTLPNCQLEHTALDVLRARTLEQKQDSNTQQRSTIASKPGRRMQTKQHLQWQLMFWPFKSTLKIISTSQCRRSKRAMCHQRFRHLQHQHP